MAISPLILGVESRGWRGAGSVMRPRPQRGWRARRPVPLLPRHGHPKTQSFHLFFLHKGRKYVHFQGKYLYTVKVDPKAHWIHRLKQTRCLPASAFLGPRSASHGNTGLGLASEERQSRGGALPRSGRNLRSFLPPSLHERCYSQGQKPGTAKPGARQK